MANICDNYIYISSENTEILNHIKKQLIDNGYDFEVYDSESNWMEGIFYSKWGFPESFMQDLTDNLPVKCDDLYIRCLSVELGNYYHELWVYNDGDWDSV